MTASKDRQVLARPPIVEVALGVQFAPLQALAPLHIGRLWDRAYREAFPHWDVRPLLSRWVETFPAVPPRLGFRLTEQPKPARVWLLNQDRTELIQVQPDRLVYNWRREGPDQPYPRFQPIRDRFVQVFEALNGFAKEDLQQAVKPDHAELVKLNRIYDVTTLPEAVTTGGALPPRAEGLVEGRSCAFQLAKLSPDGKFLGRLYVIGEERTDDDGKAHVHLEFTARGPLPDRDPNKFFTLANDWINDAFQAWVDPKLIATWR